MKLFHFAASLRLLPLPFLLFWSNRCCETDLLKDLASMVPAGVWGRTLVVLPSFPLAAAHHSCPPWRVVGPRFIFMKKTGNSHNQTEHACETWINKRIYFITPSFPISGAPSSPRARVVPVRLHPWAGWWEHCSTVLWAGMGIRHLLGGWRRICCKCVLAWYCLLVCCDWVCNMTH